MWKYVLILFVGCSLALSSCQQADPRKYLSLPEGYYPTIETEWAKTRQKIIQLETEKASVAEWREVAIEHSRVRTSVQLSNIVNEQKLSNEVATVAREKFARSSKTEYYGFEGDYHALVFFSNDRTKDVLKW